MEMIHIHAEHTELKEGEEMKRRTLNPSGRKKKATGSRTWPGSVFQRDHSSVKSLANPFRVTTFMVISFAYLNEVFHLTSLTKVGQILLEAHRAS